ncbi:23825_t:CDS:2, partial [Entrophospora sp. SA101]
NISYAKYWAQEKDEIKKVREICNCPCFIITIASPWPCISGAMLEALQQPVCSLREFYEQLNLTDHSLDNAQQFFPYFETNNKIGKFTYYIELIEERNICALQKLHEKELVFGDLCKSNIMIQEDIDCMKH